MFFNHFTTRSFSYFFTLLYEFMGEKIYIFSYCCYFHNLFKSVTYADVEISLCSAVLSSFVLHYRFSVLLVFIILIYLLIEFQIWGDL